jgi:steroid 5-alpha reductase family enzyme
MQWKNIVLAVGGVLVSSSTSSHFLAYADPSGGSSFAPPSPSIHPHFDSGARASFQFLPNSSMTQPSPRYYQRQQHSRLNFMNNKSLPPLPSSLSSWNIIPRGGQQQSQSSLTSLKLSLLDISSTLSSSVTSLSPFFQYNLVILAINFVGMLISLLFPGMQYHLDLLGTGSFALASSYIMSTQSLLQAQVFSSWAIILWSTKLATFLFYRAMKVKEDARLGATLSTKPGVVFFWLLSFLWGVISSLPHSLGLAASSSSSSSFYPSGGNNIGFLFFGTFVYIVGLFTETIADYQKWTFKQTNPGQFCNIGLWSISQHPNFVGNICIWTGITIMNLSSLAWRLVPIACLSPLILWRFFLGQAQGLVGSGVDLAMKRYGDDTGYRDYIENVPILFPDITFSRKK